MKPKLLLLSLLLASRVGFARAFVSPWTGETAPEIFSTFRYPYKVAMEVELSLRLVRLIADDFDMTPLAPMKFRMIRDFTRDYLNSTTLAQLWKDDAALAERLTAGLDLGRDIGAEIRAGMEAEQKDRLALFRKHLSPSAEAPPEPVTKANLDVRGLVTTDGRVLSRSGETSLASNDWIVLNGRWNALDQTTRRTLADLRLVSTDVKAEFINEILPFRRNWPREYEMLKAALATSRGYWKEYDVGRDGRGVTEFRHHSPESSAESFLNGLASFARATQTFGALKTPIQASRRDSGYHLNFSVEGRRQSLEAIGEAWQKLIVLRNLAAGELGLFSARHVHYNLNLANSKFVRMRRWGYLEVRDHFTDPETELAMLMSAVDLNDAEAVRLINTKFMPKITPWMLEYLYDHDRTAFLDVVFASPGLEIELPPRLQGVVEAESDRSMLFDMLEQRPRILDDSQRLADFLGPREFKKFRRKVDFYLFYWELKNRPQAASARQFVGRTRSPAVRRIMKTLRWVYKATCEPWLSLL